MIPLQALKTLLFDDGKYDLDFVLSRMFPVQNYKEEEISTEVYRDIQDKTFRVSSHSGDREGILVDILREKCKKDIQFLRDFVDFVTASHYIRQSDFKILVEFNSRENLDDGSLPIVHSCEQTLKFPVLVYNNNPEELERKLDLAMANTKACTFDMM